MKFAIVLATLAAACLAKDFYREEFDESWRDRWVVSRAKAEDGTGGIWKYECGKYCADESQTGIRTGEDARFYQISATMDEFTNKGGDLAITYVVKNEQMIDCGGWYLKFGPPGLAQEDFDGESEYNLMVGPDQCGATKRIHFILNHGGKNHLINDEVANLGEPERDQEKSHAYTFVLKKDKTYAVYVDGMKRGEGDVEAHWSVLAPREIPDPAASKPESWDDREKIADPSATKPADWDDEPAEIPKKAAKKPADWDDDVDGEWEAPMMKNPKYKGEWKAPMIENPSYQGAWVHPKVANPDYEPDSTVGEYTFGWVGIDLWQVKAGTIFTKIWVGDDVQEQLEWVRGDFRAVREKEDQLAAERQARDQEDARRRMEEEEYEYVDEDEHDEL